MTDPAQPVTLGDLLLALERTENLRSLARECGLTPGDLKRRLRQWRRELAEEAEAAAPDPTPAETTAAPAAAPKGAPARGRRKPAVDPLPPELADVPAAAGLAASPLPAAGSPVLEVWTDGASRGNPGPASVGIVFGLKGGGPVARHAEKIGTATNNVAEYRAVLRALELAAGWGVKRVSLQLDSELVARQISGQYRVKSQDLLPFYRQVMDLIRELDGFAVKHIRRERNALADALANLALDGTLPD
ncbi:MAG: ribonuclease HI family protein [bacterium]|nr:ribonuclease HI family protein [bacterium]